VLTIFNELSAFFYDFWIGLYYINIKITITKTKGDKMKRQYQMTSGYVGSMGASWRTVDEATANSALDMAAAFLKMDRAELEKLLNDGRGMTARTGKQSPNYYYDHGMEQIRSVTAQKPAPALVKCSCGHSVPRGSVMSASLGTSCPDCYDRMSE